MALGDAQDITNWLNLLFQVIYNNTSLLPVESALNFNPPLVATDNPTMGWIDVTLGANAAPGNFTASGTASFSSNGVAFVPFDANAGSMSLTMGANSADGYRFTAVDCGRATSNSHTVTFNDANGYQIEDPDSLVLSTSYVLTQVRNLTWVRTTCNRTSTTFWAAI